jgi:hypothetical protein
MSIAKTLSLSLAAVIILAVHSTSSFAEVSLSYGGVELAYSQDSAGGAASDDGDLWDYICGLLW